MRAASVALAWSLLVTAIAVSFPTARAVGTDVPPGEIAVDTTWTAAGSPYRILGDVRVAFERTLEIGPGTVVLFTGNYSLIGGSGRVLVHGTEAQPVEIRPEADTGLPGQWQRLDANELAYCHIRGANQVSVGFYGWGGRAERCTIENTMNGLMEYGANNAAFRDLTIRNAVGYGLVVAPGFDCVFANITIDRVGTGIVMQHAGNPMTGADPTDNLFTHITVSNFTTGVAINGGWPYGPSPTNVLTRSLFRDGGTVFPDSFSGFVYDNVFVNTSQDFGFLPPGGVGYYDDGSRGNYWSNYTGTDAGGDGIGDTPYGPDRFPLMNPVPNAGVSSSVPVPRVVSSSPSPSATRVSLRTSFQFDFSEPMDTRATDIWGFSAPAGNFGGTWESPTRFRVSIDAQQGTLDRSTAYTITLWGSTVSLEGMPLGEDYEVPFTTVDPPELTATEPADGATGVAPGGSIVITFNVPMNRTSVEAAVRVDPAVHYGVAWSEDGDTVTLIVEGGLAAGTTHAVTVDGNATDADGMSLPRRYVVTFSTGVAGGSGPDLRPLGIAAAFVVAALLVGFVLGRRTRRRGPDRIE